MQQSLKMTNATRTALFLAAFAVLAPAQDTVEITSEPSHHLVFENDWVRVFNVLAPARASTLVHRHNYDYLYVTLGDAAITNARVGEKPFPVVLNDGEVRFTPGGFAHAVANNSERPFHNITIELLKSSTNVRPCSDACEVPISCAASAREKCASARILLQSDQWSAISVLMPPGATYPEHAPAAPHLVVAVSDLDLTQVVDGRDRVEVRRVVGDVRWVDPVVQSITNAGSMPARFVSLQFKDML
jgi:quercetin dioxygenase-like cupin family protein